MTKRIRTSQKFGLSANLLALAFALSLFGYAIATISLASVFRDTRFVLASAIISSSASVPSNPDNRLAQEFKDKETQLNAREAQISAAEKDLLARDARGNTMSFLSLVASLILFALVAYNFYRDAQRENALRDPRSRGLAVDLRPLRRN